MTDKIILYDLCGINNIRFSPPCWNVKLCLINKKINYETVPITFSEKCKINFSGQKLVPIIRYKNEVIYDSWNIIMWLEKKFTEIKLINNEQSRIFSRFLYYWTSKHILPIIFKIIGPDIPKILSNSDAKYFVKTREKMLGTTLESLKKNKEHEKKKLNHALLLVEKMLSENNFLNGKSPGLPDYIFFGNFMWAEKCSDETIIDKKSFVFKWFEKIKCLNNL